MDPHTGVKQEILRRYLGAWFGIVGRRNEEPVYVDGFCGPGRYQGGEEGSPLMAARTAAYHKARQKLEPQLVFIDNDRERIRHLNGELESAGWPARLPGISVRHGSFAVHFEALLDLLTADGSAPPPIFAFVDPFGFKGLPFYLIKRLLSYDGTEVFINLNSDDMNRFLTHPNDAVRRHIVETFGTEEVLEVIRRPGARVELLRDLYQRQLADAAEARFVRHFGMFDSHDQLTYHLFFAGNHPLGHERMKEAMWRADPNGAFRFSDATDPRQLVMFEGPDYSVLESAILSRFAGELRLAETVLEWVVDETAFLPKHGRAVLKKAEREDGISVCVKKADGSRRQKGGFADGTQIRFPTIQEE